jgi:Uma2 family endonuclease
MVTNLFLNQETITTYSIEEYFEMEALSDDKLEYRNGKIFEMPGAKPRHNLITAWIITYLNILLMDKAKKYFVLTSDTKIHIPKLNSFVYPDAVVICEEIQLLEGRSDVVINPLLIVEVLSKSTAANDRTGKFFDYRNIPTFQEYILVEQDFPEVTSFYRKDEKLWEEAVAIGLEDKMYLKSLDISIDLSQIYRQVEF